MLRGRELGLHEARIAVRAREVRAEGLTLRGVSERLATESHLGRRGKAFSPPSVANMLARVAS